MIIGFSNIEVIGDLKKCCEEKCLIKVVKNIGMRSAETMNIDNSFEEFSAERSTEMG